MRLQDATKFAHFLQTINDNFDELIFNREIIFLNLQQNRFETSTDMREKTWRVSELFAKNTFLKIYFEYNRSDQKPYILILTKTANNKIIFKNTFFTFKESLEALKEMFSKKNLSEKKVKES